MQSCQDENSLNIDIVEFYIYDYLFRKSVKFQHALTDWRLAPAWNLDFWKLNEQADEQQISMSNKFRRRTNAKWV